MQTYASASQTRFVGGGPIGRTLPTFRRVIDQEQHRWDDLRRGLDPEHQRAFQAVFQRARRHASAAGNQGALDPFDAILLTVVLELEVELQRLLARVAWLESDADRGPMLRRVRHPMEEPLLKDHRQRLHAPEDPVEDTVECEEQEAA